MFAALGNFISAFSVDTKINIKRNVFYPGNVVEGVVVVTTTKPVLVRAIRLKFVGRENASVVVRRHEQHGDTTREVVDRYYESSVFYKELVTLAGSLKTGPQMQPWSIAPGTYYYPFAFRLPQLLPASLFIQQGEEHGGIFYQAKAYVDIPNGRDAAARAPFTVVRPLRMDQWVNPFPITQDRYFDITCCCCISKGKNAVRFYMDRTVIALDRDKIVICADIDNSACEEPVDAVVISLDHVFRCRAQGREFAGVVSIGSQRITQKVEAHNKGRVSGTFDLPRSASPSASTALLNSLYKITIELDIPWASDPRHEVNVVVAQTVDETNSCPPLVWGEATTARLNKGMLSTPERYYAPPPMPVYPYQPVPMTFAPQGAPVQTYEQFGISPLGVLPGAQWDTAPRINPGKEGQVTQPLGLHWQQGYTQQGSGASVY